MDILRMIAELRAEREVIDEALITLERLARDRGKRRGRPPTWMSAMRGAAGQEDGQTRSRTLSPETRKRMAEAQRRRWAAYRKEQAAAES
jgi:hypothetical protein